MISQWKVQGTTAIVALVFAAGSSFLVGAYKGRQYTDRDTIKALEMALGRNETLEQELEWSESKTVAELETIRADADSARSHASRLFNELSRCESNASSSNSGQTANQTEGVRAIVLGEVENRLTALAQYADQARLAGNACESQYNTVKDTP